MCTVEFNELADLVILKISPVMMREHFADLNKWYEIKWYLIKCGTP